MSTVTATLDEVMAVACAEAWRGDGEIMASPMAMIPMIGARVAKATFSPDLLLSDGIATFVSNIYPVGPVKSEKIAEGWIPYRTVFDMLWTGRRHVMMGATQIDKFGNQNISCIGDWKQPKNQLLGVRGAPGNTLNHTTSYYVPNHTAKCFVEKVDMVSGVGYDRAAKLGSAAKYHEIHVVISNKGVFDFQTPDHSMRVRSVHPGVTVEDIVANTGFKLLIPDNVPETRLPTEAELKLIREYDPTGAGKKELKS